MLFRSDKINLEKHAAELAVLHSEANKNNAISDSYLASTRNRLAQKMNATQDKIKVDPNSMPVDIQPATANRIHLKKGYNMKNPVTQKDWNVSGGDTMQTIQDMYGEPGEWIFGGTKLLKDATRHIMKKVRSKHPNANKKWKSKKEYFDSYRNTKHY